jgi:3-hydroxyisobutyrate dehydrogenase
MNPEVVFIGLGNMGFPMAHNLLRAGLSVTGFDLLQSNVDKLVAQGATKGLSLAQAIASAKLVITMLPSSQSVKNVYLGEDGVFVHAQPGTLLIDSSTISPEVAKELGKLAAERGLEMLDAPVSGGPVGATAGTLTFMAGATDKGFAAANRYLQKMGKALYHAGPHGSGQTVKVCNNMLLGITMIGTAEALRLGIANGLDPKVLTEIMSKSSGNNWVMNSCNPCPGVMEQAPASNDYAGGFGVDLMLKDLGLAVENALSTQCSVPLGANARNLYDMHSKAGNGKLDYGSIYRMLGKHS